MSNLLYKLIFHCCSLNQEEHEFIPKENEGNYIYPLFYNGTDRRDYDMACFVLGREAITIQELSVYFQEINPDSENKNTDIGTSPLGSNW